MSSIRLKLAQIAIELRRGSANGPAFEVPANHGPFLCDDRPDLILTCHDSPVPEHLLRGTIVYDESRLWTLHQGQRGLIWRQPSVCVSLGPERLVAFGAGFREADVFVPPSDVAAGHLRYPLYHPLDKFLFGTLLGFDQGVTCHACGISDSKHGFLFVGESGAGKSTMAELWHGLSGVKVLSDERTTVRSADGGFRIYGTPWHGTAGLFSPACAPLAAVFFLHHGPRSRVAQVGVAEAVRRFLVCTYLPFWSAVGIEHSLALLHAIGHSVPCYDLTFVPDGGIVDFLRDFLSG